MCLAVPAKIKKILENREYAIVDYGDGITRKVNISLVNVSQGDYVVVHAGFAIEKIDEDKAMETINIFREILSIEKEMV
jgi:hydrogenase expression/formation protein HypC